MVTENDPKIVNVLNKHLQGRMQFICGFCEELMEIEIIGDDEEPDKQEIVRMYCTCYSWKMLEQELNIVELPEKT